MNSNESLPCDRCRGGCCTMPAFSSEELQIVKLVRGLPSNAVVIPMQQSSSYDFSVVGKTAFVLKTKDSENCPYLLDGKCSIYELRPKVCKDYGNHPQLPCAYLYPEKAKAQVDEFMRRAK